MIITNISQLLLIDAQNKNFKRGKELSDFPIIENAYLSIKDDLIDSFGLMSELSDYSNEDVLDAQGGIVWPSWIDSHTHLVYAGTREDEFAQRLHGASYEEIANKGGGILNSVKKLRNASFDELYSSAEVRLKELLRMGTGALEVKSGYGLDLENELKMLKVARALEKEYKIPIKTSLLAAHAIPIEFKDNRRGYVDYIINEILPAAHEQKLLDYIDVFCEKGYFTAQEMQDIIVAAQKFGVKSKLHVNQFNSLGAIQIACEHDALSVDHLEVLSEEEARILGESNTIATALPGCSLFLEIPYTPAKLLIENNAILALATDFNPGSAPSGNMNLMVSLACIKMKLTPEQAISAATLNGAAAIELSDTHGSIKKGKKANLNISGPLHSYSFIPYNFGHNHVKHTILNGKLTHHD